MIHWQPGTWAVLFLLTACQAIPSLLPLSSPSPPQPERPLSPPLLVLLLVSPEHGKKYYVGTIVKALACVCAYTPARTHACMHAYPCVHYGWGELLGIEMKRKVGSLA